MSVGAFGKLPSAGDFVRYNVTAPGALAFEQWVQQGIEWAAVHHDKRWQPPFDEGLTYGFMLGARPESSPGELLVGVLSPSQDAVGRRYPFTVFSSVADGFLAGAPHLGPLALGEFLNDAADVAADAWESSSPNIEPAMSRLRPATPAAIQQHHAQYEHWTMNTEAVVALALTFGGDALLPRSAHALETMLQCIQPWRGVEYPDTPLAVRLPISAGGVSSVAFWVDVARRMAAWQRTVPTVFWHWDGTEGAMLLQFGVTPPGTFVELWVPDSESEHICDLVTPSPAALSAAFERVSPNLGAVLGAPGARVCDLLAALNV